MIAFQDGKLAAGDGPGYELGMAQPDHIFGSGDDKNRHIKGGQLFRGNGRLGNHKAQHFFFGDRFFAE